MTVIPQCGVVFNELLALKDVLFNFEYIILHKDHQVQKL